MDVSDIGKVVNIKKFKENAGKIREKVNRENANIIKMKVAQDTSYWDLKEKLHQLEVNYERLQQNTVELQMQFETVSMKYQDELRQRSEILNKVASMKALVDLMEEYISNMTGTLSRTRSDCGALAAGYANVSCSISDLKAKYLEMQRANTEEALDRSRLISELAANTNEKCNAAMNNVADAINNQHSEVLQKNEMISNLQSEVKQLTEELNAGKCDLQSTIANYEMKLAEGARYAEELRGKVNIAEQAVNLMRDQLTTAERERSLLQQVLDNTNLQLQETTSTVDRLNKSLIEVNVENQNFSEIFAEKNQIISEKQDYIDKLVDEIAVLNINCAATEAILKETKEAKHADDIKIEKMTEELCTLQKESNDVKDEFKKFQEESERKSVNAGNMISGLMAEVQVAVEAADKLKAEIHALKANAATEQDSLKMEETRQRARADKLECTIKDRDKEIAELKIVTQKKEKEIEWLKDKIRTMQKTIDNIQKELTSRLHIGPPVQTERPERDQQHKFTKPSLAHTSQSKNDYEIFNFLSNTSSDSEALPTLEINRRFDTLAKRARGDFIDGKIDGDNAEDKISSVKGTVVGGGARGARRGQSPLPVSVSQMRNESEKKRAFFKNKNSLSRSKKIK